MARALIDAKKRCFALVSLMADFTSDQKHSDISPYLRRPLRSLRQACLDRAARARRTSECVDCPATDACQDKAEKQIGPEELE